jgi:hypothetical protein
MNIKDLLKNMTRMQSLEFIRDLILHEMQNYDPSGIGEFLENAKKDMDSVLTNIEAAGDEHYKWIHRDKDEDGVLYANFRKDMDSE